MTRPRPRRNPRDEEGMLTRDFHRDRIDDEAARELELWIPNHYESYRHYQAVAKNMTRKKAAGKYDRELAVKGFEYTAEFGAKSYAKEVGGGKWHELFNKPTRQHVAAELRDQFEREFEDGEWDEEIPKKYRKKKKATKKKAAGKKSPKRNPAKKLVALISETNTPVADKKIQRAFAAFKNERSFPSDDYNTWFEHGQWWVVSRWGDETWSVVDAVPGVDSSGIDFEEV